MPNHKSTWIDKIIKFRLSPIRLSYLIDKTTNKSEDFFFIQIGACDGIIQDPIHEYILKYKWNGILVEPIKYLFDRLIVNYTGRNNLIFENVAIAETAGERSMYRYKENQNDLPEWYEGTASLFYNFSRRHGDIIQNIEQRLVKEKIPCIMFDTLLQKYNVKKIDLLLIDTEGYEYEILKTINFKEIKPSIICYEYQCLSKDMHEKCDKILKDNGYIVISLPDGDAYAFLDKTITKFNVYSNIYSYFLKSICSRIFRKLKNIYSKRATKILPGTKSPTAIF